ncbi:MAG: Cytochrome c7 and related cytochrome c [Acidobacteriota bacterium]|nr:Cytochrome c7 and related cytochrome c [Acidobacteriota bacterium]
MQPLSGAGATVSAMTVQTDSKAKPETTARASEASATSRRVLSLVVLLLFCVCALLMLFAGRPAVAVTKDASVQPSPESLAETFFTPAPQDYSRFSHSYPSAHAALSGRWSCSICHTRSNNAIEPGFPQHKDCISCHQTQFTTPNSPLCSICHTTEGLSQQNPPLKKFSRLRSFNAEFDHAQHTTGLSEARSQQGCATCHAPARRGVAKTIPAGLGAHQTCYQCHTPGKQSRGVDISSCGACHAPGRYAPTSAAARSFRIGFSHADHGARESLNCDSCHNVAPRGLPQGRQVSSTFPAQHFPTTRAQSCVTCHNGQRTFGETNFNDCKRCHSGQTFRL